MMTTDTHGAPVRRYVTLCDGNCAALGARLPGAVPAPTRAVGSPWSWSSLHVADLPRLSSKS